MCHSRPLLNVTHSLLRDLTHSACKRPPRLSRTFLPQESVGALPVGRPIT